METIPSQDGTPIAFKQSGEGPPLVLVHGTGGSHTRWAPILPRLEAQFRVVALNRRGRGGSGDGPAYAIAREAEDVAAVVGAAAMASGEAAEAVADGAAGEPACLLGHSYGAMCSLEAALLLPSLRKLVLYEPPIPVAGAITPPGLVDRLDALLAAGDRAGVLTTFFREVVRMPAAEMALMQDSPAWPARLAAAHTLPRELRAGDAYRLDPARFRDLHVPTLLLLGGDSPPFFRAAIETLHAALPHSQVAILPGQQHIAIDTAPTLFADAVLSFLTT